VKICKSMMLKYLKIVLFLLVCLQCKREYILNTKKYPFYTGGG